jgi:hypothetical protein
MIMKNEWPVMLLCLMRVLPPIDYSPISAPRLDDLLTKLIS